MNDPNFPARRSPLPAVLLVLLAGLVLLLVVLILPGPRTSPPGQSRLFFTGRPGVWFSVRDFNRYTGDLLELRTVAFPLTGGLNRILFGIEYVIDHEFTRSDLNEFLGHDFTIQISPRFLLVTRTRKEYNVFMYLDIKDDPVVPWRGAVIRRKELRPLRTTVYYSFLDDYCAVSPDLGCLKSFLRRADRTGAGFGTGRGDLENAEVAASHSPGRDAFSPLFGAGRWTLFGSSLNSMRLAGDGNMDTRFDRNCPVFFNVETSVFGTSGTPVQAKVMIRDLHLTGRLLSLGYWVLVPREIPAKKLAIVRRWVTKNLSPAGSDCLVYPFSEWIVLSDSAEAPTLDRTGLVLSADTVRLASYGVFPSGVDTLLTETQGIIVRALP